MTVSLATTGLPRFCPSWCTNTHQQAVDEGCTAKEARVHSGPDVTGQAEVDGERMRWELELKADSTLRGGTSVSR